MPRLLLAQMLKQRGFSKRKFAKDLGERYTNVFRYFNSGYDPKLSTLAKWAAVLNCQIADLFSENGQKKPKA
jgi:transcriptional regulator with XRE-family HTH domain